MGSERLGPLSDCTENCRPILSSEMAPLDTIPQISDSNILTGCNIWSQVLQGYPMPRYTDWLTVSPKATWTSTSTCWCPKKETSSICWANWVGSTWSRRQEQIFETSRFEKKKTRRWVKFRPVIGIIYIWEFIPWNMLCIPSVNLSLHVVKH
jgi:hypothetical protein